MNEHAERLITEAVRFRPRIDGRVGNGLRVAKELLTCQTAATILNELGLSGEFDSAYNYINVFDPRCPLIFDIRANRWNCAPGLAQHPVWGVNWSGARLLCEHLGGRLPTMKEWESFASNNDPLRRYPWGDAAPTDALANYDEHVGGTTIAGCYPPSELGLFDLAGNLSEWCQDLYEPHGVGSGLERVAKGGAWSKEARLLQIRASRGKWECLGTTTIGIRPVWDD